VTVGRRLLLLVAGAAAIVLQWFGGPWWQHHARELTGNSLREGPWLFARHVRFQTTVTALVCVLAWWLLARRGWLPPIRESLHVREPRRIVAWAALASAAIIAIVTTVILAFGGNFAPHVPHGWDVLGNMFSNFYEELIFSGFVFVVLREVTGSNKLAVVGVAAVFGAVHTQYPVELRASIFVTTVIAGVARVKTGTIWTTWLIHQVADVVLDALFF